jgi:hypothetical protein
MTLANERQPMLERKLKDAVPLLFTCVSALGCAEIGFEVDEVDDADEAVAADHQPVSLHPTQFWWTNALAPVKMTPTDTSVCFIVQIEGQFHGDGEAVYIEAVDGFWQLNGRAATPKVLISARCITGIDLDTETTKEFRWVQGTHSNGQRVEIKSRSGNTLPTDTWSCFLTRMEGNFLGYGEDIRVYVADNKWVIEGKSLQQSVVGGARCVKKTRHSGGTWKFGDPIVQLPYSPSDNDVCFLTRVSGNFNNYDWVGTFVNGDKWHVWGSTHHGVELMAGARCLE